MKGKLARSFRDISKLRMFAKFVNKTLGEMTEAFKNIYILGLIKKMKSDEPLLKEGITGFLSIPSAEIILQDHKLLERLIYSYFINYNKLHINKDLEITKKNFYLYEVSYEHEKFYILLNAFKPVIAFAKKVEPFNIEFKDIEELSHYLNHSYKVLNSVDANKDITERDLNELDKIEINQIKYWKPRSIGEVIFNYWD